MPERAADRRSSLPRTEAGISRSMAFREGGERLVRTPKGRADLMPARNKWSDLRAETAPETRERAARKTTEMLKALPLHEPEDVPPEGK